MEQQIPPIRILIVEAHSLLRDMLRSALAAESGLIVVGATGDAAEAISIAAAEHPGLALVGLQGAGDEEHALAAAEGVSSVGTRVLFLGEQPDRRTMAALPAFRAAGWSYLLRDSVTDIAALVAAMERASAGSVMLDPRIIESVAERDERITALTKRQREVLSLMAEGLNNAAIAKSLVLEEKSVENHINAIFGHLNVSRDNAAHPRVKAVLLYLQDTLGTADAAEPADRDRRAA